MTRYQDKRMIKYAWLVVGTTYPKFWQQQLDIDTHFLDVFRYYHQ
jgi:hypothetical protein